jgi:hypothetical protein
MGEDQSEDSLAKAMREAEADAIKLNAQAIQFKLRQSCACSLA